MNFKDTKLKVLSLVLILTMVFTTGVPVFAEDGGSSTPTETQSVEKATEKATEAPTQIATEKKATQAQTQANTQKSTVAKETKKGEATTGTSKTVKKVTVTYDANGGKEDNVYKTITLNDNDQASLTLPKNTFARDGYEFAFWAKDKDATSGSDEGDSVTIKENTRYYAIWKKVETSEKDKTQVTTDKNSKDSVEESTEATESTEETDPTDATNNIDVANEEANNENISIIDVEGDETKGSYQIEVGATQSITGTRSAGSSWRDPNNNTTVYESWTSSNDNIASVSGSGKSATVKGVAEGEAIITHTYGEKMWSGFGPSRIYTRTETFKITVIAASTDPTLKVSPTTINMKKIGETHVVTPIIDNEPEGATITWSSSNEKVATVKGGASGGTVTAVANGTATITATLSYEDEGGIVQTLTASTTVNVDFTQSTYNLYYYALIPGADADSDTSADTRWFGLGEGKISGVEDPSNLENGTTITNYSISSSPSFPSITYKGVTYKYAQAGSANADKLGYYTLSAYRVVRSEGANAGANNYNTVVSGKTATYHYDFVMNINEPGTYTVNFAVSYPEDNGAYETLTAYAKRVKQGTSESKLTKPSATDVPETKIYNGLTYKFDGWYRDSSCNLKADFAGKVNYNITYYAKYVPTNQRYTVEYYYDGRKASRETETLGPVDVGTKITTYKDKAKTGYTLDHATVSEQNPLIIDVDASKNVIKVYYTKKQVEYTVNYYLNGTTTKVAESETAKATCGEAVTGTLKDVSGYTAVDPNTKTKTIVVDEQNKEINFYYYKNVKLTANSATKTYNGAEQSVSGYTTDASDSVKFDVNIGAKGTDVGDYTADASSAKGAVDKTEKYIVTETVNGTLTINARQITVTANNASKVYGEADPTFSAEVEGTLNGDTITYTVSRPGAGTDEDVKTYKDAIVPTGDGEQGNYKVKYVSADFTITKASGMTINATNVDETYSGKEYGAAASASIKDGTTIYYSVNGGEETTKVPTVTDVKDSCTVKVRATNPNYEDTVTEYKMTIKPFEINIFEQKTVNWTGEEQTLNIAENGGDYGQVSGETISVKGATIKGTDIGDYTDVAKDYTVTVTKASGADSTGNYTVNVSGKLKINPASPEDMVEIDTSASGYSGVYDGQEHGKAAILKVSDDLKASTKLLYSIDGKNWIEEYPTATDVKDSCTVKVKATNPNFESDFIGDSYKLNITKRPLVVYKQATMEADGTTKTLEITKEDLVNGSVENEGLVEGEELTIDDATISGKDPGTYTDVSDYTWKVTRGTGKTDVSTMSVGDSTDTTDNYSMELTGKLTLTGQPDNPTPTDPTNTDKGNADSTTKDNADSSTTKVTTAKKDNGAKTGDNTPIGMLFGLMGVALAGGGFAVFGRKKEDEK